jgi:hypothetical protein
MDNALLMHFLDTLDHLDRDVQDRFKIKFAATFLEEILQGFAKQVHHHYVEHLAVFSFFVTHKMKERHIGFAAQLVNKLALPEEHDVALHAHCFFL